MFSAEEGYSCVLLKKEGIVVWKIILSRKVKELSF